MAISISLLQYVAANSTGASVVIAPGGAYWSIATTQEGTPYGQWLCAHGMASYVSTYRCASTGYVFDIALLFLGDALKHFSSFDILFST